MRLSSLLVVWALVCVAASLEAADDDFDEFEFDLDDEDSGKGERDVQSEEEEEDEDEDMLVEVEDEEGFEDDWDSDKVKETKKPLDNLKIAESAVRMKPFWEAYVLEILVVTGMVLYIVNYLIGRGRNSSLAQSWLEEHRELLEKNFMVVGDTGEGEEPTEWQLIKESDSVYSVWASGRVNCEGMLVQLKFKKRHDLLAVLYSVFNPSVDTVTVVVRLGDDDMESFTLALGQKRVLFKMAKEYQDLKDLCTPPKPGTKQGLNETLFVLSEIPEATSAFLSKAIVTGLNKHAGAIESLHLSDQYTGFVQDSDDSEVTVVKKPQKRLQMAYTMLAGQQSLLQLVLSAVDQARGMKLSREARDKAIRNRSKVAQGMEKLQHAQRQEAAQQRKEEKKKAEKERMMLETDPEKTRKWEEKEHKKAMKRMQPRMQKMKVRMG